MKEEFSGKKVLVIGLGISGKAAARFLLKRGAFVTAIDRNADLFYDEPTVKTLIEKGLQVFSEKTLSMPLQYDVAVVSPGIPHENVIYTAVRKSKIPLIGEIDLACRSMRQRAVAVTGTNGKTTTVSLITHALNFGGMPARALGNIGTPLTDAVDEANPNEILVVELSSWQLETLTVPAFEAAAILNITPNHLDRHKTMLEYAKAKFRLAACIKKGGVLYLGSEIPRNFSEMLSDIHYETYGFETEDNYTSDGTSVYLSGEQLFRLPPPYLGKKNHDVENMMAAYALCRHVGLSDTLFVESLKTFKKPAHRVEFVSKIDGVSYYDDSKGTNLEAVIRAVQTMDGETILIAGGLHKGASYLSWAQSFKGKVRFIYAIGQAAPQITAELSQFLPVRPCASLEEAVRFAASSAKNGENVLLSPGCSSYDMFRDFNHRGDEFKRIVNALQSEVNEK